MQEHLFEILCLVLGSDGLFLVLQKYLNDRSKTRATIKALCYNYLSDKLNAILTKGYATETDRRDIQVLYAAYHGEGWNGDMDDRMERVFNLPFHPDQQLTVIQNEKETH